MIVIASRSSTTASVSRNVRSALGRCVDSTASTASAKAMSVAIGTAHPSRFSCWPAMRFVVMKMAAGTTIPPTAAAMGSAARAGSRRSPATNSEKDRQQAVGRARRQAKPQMQRFGPKCNL
jgi:hypothetical protein